MVQTDDDGEWGGAEPTASRVTSRIFFGKSLSEIYQKNGTLEKGLPIPVYHCIQALMPFVKVPNLFLTQGKPDEVRATYLPRIPHAPALCRHRC